MRKTFKLEELDCAVCAARMEKAVREIDGVTDASVSFAAQRMAIEAPDDIFDEVLKKARKVCKRVEPDCTILL